MRYVQPEFLDDMVSTTAPVPMVEDGELGIPLDLLWRDFLWEENGDYSGAWFGFRVRQTFPMLTLLGNIPGDAVKMQSHFDHLSETYFNNFEYDLGERELGYALSFNHDLEMFAASVGLIKTILRDNGEWHPYETRSTNTKSCFPDVPLDMGGVDAEAEFFQSLQNALNLCRSAKVLSKLIKRVKDLMQGSMAFKAHFVPQLQTLTNTVPELVNFSMSVGVLDPLAHFVCRLIEGSCSWTNLSCHISATHVRRSVHSSS